jgi:hypothetical protein
MSEMLSLKLKEYMASAFIFYYSRPMISSFLKASHDHRSVFIYTVYTHTHTHN